MFAARYIAVAFLSACSFTPGALVDAGSSDSGPADAAASCESSDSCATASLLGTLSGDTGNQKVTASGHLAAWFRVRVTENDTDIGGTPMRLAARLTSPATVGFHVFAYVDVDSDRLECMTSVGMPTTNGAVEEVRLEWGEGSVANGDVDSRDVSIEVRPTSTSCDASAPWMLELEGNWTN